MPRPDFATMQCSLARSLDLIGDRWSPLILRDLSYGPLRFDELAEDLGIARNLLTTRLNGLVDAGVVTRTPYQQHPPRFNYELSGSGVDLVPVLMALTAWGDRWANDGGDPHVLYRHRECGQFVTPTVCCSQCALPLSLEAVDIHPGRGGLIGRGTLLAREFMARRLAATKAPVVPRGR